MYTGVPGEMCQTSGGCSLCLSMLICSRKFHVAQIFLHSHKEEDENPSTSVFHSTLKQVVCSILTDCALGVGSNFVSSDSQIEMAAVMLLWCHWVPVLSCCFGESLTSRFVCWTCKRFVEVNVWSLYGLKAGVVVSNFFLFKNVCYIYDAHKNSCFCNCLFSAVADTTTFLFFFRILKSGEYVSYFDEMSSSVVTL
jgi:hypothetical protein